MGGSKSRFIPRSRAVGMAESTEQMNKALLVCASSSAPGVRSSPLARYEWEAKLKVVEAWRSGCDLLCATAASAPCTANAFCD